jgi:type VI secretion system protein ImpB
MLIPGPRRREEFMSSLQHKLDRVRRPRVQITYDVETNGAMQKIELPFVVGVLADLSGMPKEPLRLLKERQAVFIDRDNFNNVLSKAAPRLAMSVPNRLADESAEPSKVAVELNFRSMDDFEPANVAAQIPALKELLDMRHNLNQLLSKMEGNDKLESLLAAVLQNTDTARELAKGLGIEPAEGGAAGEATK